MFFKKFKNFFVLLFEIIIVEFLFFYTFKLDFNLLNVLSVFSIYEILIKIYDYVILDLKKDSLLSLIQFIKFSLFYIEKNDLKNLNEHIRKYKSITEDSKTIFILPKDIKFNEIISMSETKDVIKLEFTLLQLEFEQSILNLKWNYSLLLRFLK